MIHAHDAVKKSQNPARKLFVQIDSMIALLIARSQEYGVAMPVPQQNTIGNGLKF